MSKKDKGKGQPVPTPPAETDPYGKFKVAADIEAETPITAGDPTSLTSTAVADPPSAVEPEPEPVPPPAPEPEPIPVPPAVVLGYRTLSSGDQLFQPEPVPGTDPMLVRCLRLFERIQTGGLLFPTATQAVDAVAVLIDDLRKQVYGES